MLAFVALLQDLRCDTTIPGCRPAGAEGTRGVHVARVRITDIKTKKTVTVERAFFVR